ncbi:hypothetical protein Ddye_017319 [Dipteronia dyeriana]|uniref:DDE Tnp4 domain-containing protein n=1 Tax=Dipteronia dyeriana TaxID=168575 RepID=A0AAD9X1C3_9ROSI|nr:hypothetical protein Ddye_017319 [Dipteronia dyeriana]
MSPEKCSNHLQFGMSGGWLFVYIMYQSSMNCENELEEDEIEGEEIEGEGMEVDEIDEEETDGEDMDVKEFKEDEEFYEIIKHLVVSLNTIALDMLTKPGSLTSKLRESTRYYPYFKGCIRGVDGTHISAMITGCKVSSYRNRHRIISQNVLAACNFDLEFMYVLSGWDGKYFLVDCGFPNRRQFVAPFRGVRYHLQEFGGQGRDLTNKVELFNLHHASLRNVIERIFGLHNFLRNESRSDEFSVEQDNELDPKLVDEVDPEPVFQTQEQQRTEANEWRHAIALNMWMDARHNDDNENQ